MTAERLLSPIQLVTVSVADLQESLRFYGEGLGFTEVSRQTLAEGSPVVAELWGGSSSLAAEVVILESADAASRSSTAGRLRLVEFGGWHERRKIWEHPTRIQDLGHYAVNFRMHDLRAGYPGMIAAGGIEKSEPTFWTVNDDISVWDSQLWDPNGTVLDVFEVQGELVETLGPFDAPASEVQTLAIHVADAEASHRFYSALGFSDVLYQATIENLESFFGAPEGTALININLMQKPVSPVGRVELAEYRGANAERLDDVAKPPNLGPIGSSFLVSDIERAVTIAAEHGATPKAGPFECTLEPWGRVRAARVSGLDGEALELVERL